MISWLRACQLGLKNDSGAALNASNSYNCRRFHVANSIPKLLAFRLKSSDAALGSKRLQLNKGGGATPFLLRDLDCGDVISIPTAPTSFLIHSTGLAKAARQQKAALTARQRRRASKTSRHGWQTDPITRWKWRDCSVGGFGCCSALSVPELFRNLFTISNRKRPHRLVACLPSSRKAIISAQR